MEHQWKVLVIGIDGGTWDLIKPLAEEGKLPTFKNLMRNGAYGNLTSILPIHTIPAWNCMVTGQNPGKLGVFTFMQRENGSYLFRPYFLLKKLERNTIIDLLSENGKKVCCINLPSLHYAYKINGYLVAGWLYYPKLDFTYPKNLKSELDMITGSYEIDTYQDMDIYHMLGDETEDKEDFLKQLRELTEKRTKASEYLFDKQDADFFMVIFTGADRIQHRFWKDKNEMKEYYQHLDNSIAKFLNKADEDTIIMLVSDHGFGPEKNIFNINEWLLEKGFLKLKDSDQRIRKTRKILKKLHLWDLGKRFTPQFLVNYVEAKSHPISFMEADIDWSETKAYASTKCGEIYINLKGREPEGTIDPGDEYEKLRNLIIQELKELQISGKGVPAKVFRKEELYFGRYIDQAPDLVIQLDDNISGISTSIGYGSIFSKGKGGNHRINGIFLVYGPCIKRGVEIKDLKIIDIAPTILHIMGLAIPKEADGRVLKEIFEEDSELYKKPITYQGIDEKERVKEKIRELKIAAHKIF
jgi:predicted AlkP superfamily phosphohydrolase/phosphomutase